MPPWCVPGRSPHFPDRCSPPGETSGNPPPDSSLVRFVDVGCGFGGLLIK